MTFVALALLAGFSGIAAFFATDAIQKWLGR